MQNPEEKIRTIYWKPNLGRFADEGWRLRGKDPPTERDNSVSESQLIGGHLCILLVGIYRVFLLTGPPLKFTSIRTGPPLKKPKQGQLCFIQGKTQDNSWSGAWPYGKPTASSVVVFEAQHGGDQLTLRNFRGGPVRKLETSYLPKNT